MVDAAQLGEDDVLEIAAGWRGDGLGVALATVVATWGSSPRPTGSQLVVDENGLQDEGYAIMPVKGADQLKYGCNCLNLGAGRIVSVHEETARHIVSFEGFEGHVQHIDWSPITSMYGAVHCGSQVIVRRALPDQDDEGTQRSGKRFRGSLPRT